VTAPGATATPSRRRRLRSLALVAGILSSPLYVATDVLATRRYHGYSYADQTVSELLANGAPSRPLFVALAIPYDLLTFALAAGVWLSARGRAFRGAAIALAGYAAFSTLGGLVANMNPRGARQTFPASLHVPATLAGSLFLLASMAFAAAASSSRRFRRYTVATILLLLGFGAWAAQGGPKIAAGDPTPWVGLKERVNIYATMLWVAVFAWSLLRHPATAETKPPAPRETSEATPPFATA
jgi:hypothetical protein